MRLDSVREVKNQARGLIAQMLRNDVSRRRLGVRAQSIENAIQPEISPVRLRQMKFIANGLEARVPSKCQEYGLRIHLQQCAATLPKGNP